MIKKANCMFCHRNCGVLVEVEDGKLVKVRPNPEQKITRGAMCIKATAAIEHHYHPDRLNYPLKRMGERGEGKWERINWEQTLNEIADKLKQIKSDHGAESVVFGRGTYRTDYWSLSRFQHLYGSPNMYTPGQICFCNTWSIHTAVYGACAIAKSVMPGTPPQCLVIWGLNQAESYPPTWKAVLGLKERGTKIITVDPRRVPAAEAADIWLQIRPQTDGALALAWLNVIINEGLYEKDFVDNWTYGFDQIKERIQEYPPDRVAEICWIPADKIIQSARLYAESNPAVLSCGVKLDQIGKNSTHTIQAQCILRAITGNLDVEGGEPFGRTGDILKAVDEIEMELQDKLSHSQRQKQIGADKFKLFSWPGYEMICEPSEDIPYASPPTANLSCAAHEPSVWRAILNGDPYPIKALIVQANNPMVQGTNSKEVYDALKALDMLVVMDYFMTPTGMLADYVLPATDWVERPVVTGIDGTRNFIIAGERAVDPEFERRDDFQLWRGLGLRLGQEEFWPWETLEDCFDHRIKPMGYNLQKLVDENGVLGPREYKKYEKHGFATPTKKVELYSTIFEKLGYDPLPKYEEAPETPVSAPDLAMEYPLILTTGGRIKYFYHSEFRQVQSMRKRHPDPILQIHPTTAEGLGIEDHDWVTVETHFGKVKFKAELFDGIDPRVVHAEHSWWFPEKPGEEPSLYGVWESNVNVLINNDPDHCDPICGGWPHMGLCKVYRAKA
jgi:anaerobic selenocysteine-containing dehydrogenase